jgi:hypothetical protein
MSNLQSIRQQMKNFITDSIHVDEEDLDSPKHYISETSIGKLGATLTVYPVVDIEYRKIAEKQVEATAGLRYSLNYRLPGNWTLEEVDISRFESVVQFLLADAQISLPGCSGVKAILPRQQIEPLSIRRDEKQQNDWLIHLNFEFGVVFSLTEYDVPDEFSTRDLDENEVPEIVSFSLKVYRGEIDDLATNVLDYEDDLLEEN